MQNVESANSPTGTFCLVRKLSKIPYIQKISQNQSLRSCRGFWISLDGNLLQGKADSVARILCSIKIQNPLQQKMRSCDLTGETAGRSAVLRQPPLEAAFSPPVGFLPCKNLEKSPYISNVMEIQPVALCRGFLTSLDPLCSQVQHL